MITEEKLLPCPFCGGEAHLEDGGFNHTRAACTVCRAMCGREHVSGSRSKLVKQWNVRTSNKLMKALERVYEQSQRYWSGEKIDNDEVFQIIDDTCRNNLPKDLL